MATGFESHAQFVTFRRRLGPALQRAAGSWRPAPHLPEASRHLIDFVRENGGINRRLPPHLEHIIGALARAAARRNLSIAQLRDTDVASIFDDITGTERRSAKRGLIRVNDLILRKKDLPEIAELLPAETLPEVARSIQPKSPWAKSNRQLRGERLWRDFDRFVERRRGRDALGRPIPPEKSRFGKKAEASYAHYLASALALLDRHGQLERAADPRLADVCNRETIEAVVTLWNLRQLDGEVKEKASTLHLMVARLSVLAVHCGAKRKDLKKLKKLKASVRQAGRVGRMKAEHVSWVRDFSANPRLQKAVFGMPDQLMREAQGILASWETHKRAKRQKLMMRALSLGIAACAAAILFRASPVRAANLRTLKFRGDDSHLVRGDDGLRLEIPGAETKNGKDIDHAADDDAWPVIAWYLAEIRPRLVSDHPYLRKSRAPLVDSDFLFPSTAWGRALEETSFAKHYATGCEAVGLRMCLHLARHITVFLILSEDPNAWSQAAAVLCDEVATVRKHYAWLDIRAAGREGRALMKRSRAKARKRLKGGFLDAA